MRSGTRRNRHLLTIAIAVIVAACSGSTAGSGAPTAADTSSIPTIAAPSSAAQPAAPESAAPRRAVASGARDAWLVVGRPGETDTRVILASSGEELIKLPLGVPDATWGRLVTVTTSRPNSLIRDLVVQPGFGGAMRTVEGAWQLPTVGLDPMPAGVSADGSTIVLVEDIPDGASTRSRSRFAIVERSLGAEPRIVELPGLFDFDALSPDGAILYVAEHVPGPLAGRYQVRAIDTATGRMRDTIIVDKRNVDEQMAGWPIDQEARPDGVVLTLYRGFERPFVHALQSTEAWAVCIDLPTRGMENGGATGDWGVVATPDRGSSIAVNATLGIVVDIGPDLTISRTVDFEPSARRGITLAKFGHIDAGAVGRRVVAAPDGSAVFAAGSRGIVRIATADLAVTSRSLEGLGVDAIAITPDGGTLYALVRDDGRIAQIDAATGEVLGWVAGEGYDRMVGVVPW
jgi:hypothetical protein